LILQNSLRENILPQGKIFREVFVLLHCKVKYFEKLLYNNVV